MRKHKSPTKPQPQPETPAPVKIGQEIVTLNKRTKEISAKIEKLDAESERLTDEQTGIDLRRADLRREFDQAATP